MEVLGIDIGGSAVKGAVVQTENGLFLTDRIRLETKDKIKPKKMGELINNIINQFSWNGIVGIGFPGVVKDGTANTAANVNSKWIGININELIKKMTGLTSYSVNDADAAGLTEITMGAGKEYHDEITIMLTLGTGIGSAIFVKGNLLPNTEFGHLKIRGKEAEKRCSASVKVEKNLGWKEWAILLQEYLDMLEFLLNPDIIIIGGGISKDHEKYFPLIRTRAKLMPAKYFNQAGIIGSALFAAHMHNRDRIVKN